MSAAQPRVAADLTHAYTTSVGPRLHYVAAGPADGHVVVLLHGFPDFWYGWRHQINALAAAGLRVIAPDLRGYNLSQKPPGVAPYRVDALVEDVLRLASEVAPGQTITLVGHDWGANLAWWIALRHPDRLARLGILNVPHPAVFLRYLLTHPRQLRKSWYVFAVQLPWAPEWALGRHAFAGMRRSLRASGLPSTFSDADLERYHEAWSLPGAFTAMLNWYRAAARHMPRPSVSPRVTVPTLILWGAQDVALELGMAEPSRRLCDNGRLVVYDRASHWVQVDEAERVNQELIGFIRGAATGP